MLTAGQQQLVISIGLGLVGLYFAVQLVRGAIGFLRYREVARRQMRGAFGGMVTLVLEGGLAAAERFYDRLRLVARAASLGGVESLASLPLHTSHHGLAERELAEAGIDPGMVRLSMGVEDAEDLIADVEQALAG